MYVKLLLHGGHSTTLTNAGSVSEIETIISQAREGGYPFVYLHEQDGETNSLAVDPLAVVAVLAVQLVRTG